MDNKIILNRIQTPDGTILTSYHRHDYRTHCDEITGETYMVDGGTGYLHRSVNNIPATDLTIHDDEPFEVLRHFAHWGTRGKDGKQPLRWNPPQIIRHRPHGSYSRNSKEYATTSKKSYRDGISF